MRSFFCEGEILVVFIYSQYEINDPIENVFRPRFKLFIMMVDLESTPEASSMVN